MSRTKSLLRNAQRIGDSKTPDINQEPTQDLLQKLKDYRSSSKYTSPQKALSKHITTPLPNKHNSSYQKISSRSSRPCTSPYPENLANSNKPLENPGHRANKHSHDLYYQDRSNDRLYRGARVLIGKTTQENLTARGNYKDLSHFFTSEEKAEFEEFLDSIQLLYPLRFDLELNFELVRGEVTSLQHTMAGDYYSLKEKIEGLLKEQEETMKAITSSEIVKLFQEHNRIVRHVLLGLKLKGDGNEATIVEMLWRIIVKLFDNALVVHERGINEMAEMAKIKSRNILKEYSEKLKFLGEANESTKEDYEKRIEKYQEQIKLLQVTLQAKEKAIALKDEKMADLLEIGNRDKSCIEMSRVLKKLNTYIGETEDQQYKQVAALSDIEYVMKMAETFDSKQECASKLTQTDWSIPDSRFPEFIYPKVSGNYFYPLYRPCPDIDFNVVIRNLKRALDECDGEQQFYKQYGEYLIKNYNRQDTEDHLVATAWCLLQNKSVQTSFFSVLLRFQVPISMQFELGLLKINQILISIDNKSAEGYLPLNKTIEALQSAMPSNKDQIERLISSLAFHVSGQIDLKVSLWVLICRFYFALEKTKKPLKFHLEQLDTKKENIIQSFAMIEWMRNKLGLWMKDSEMICIVEYFGGDIMRVQNVLERFSAAKIEKCKEIYVEKEEILLGLVEEWKKYQGQQVKICQKLLEMESYNDFLAEVSSHGKIIQEQNIKNAYIELMLGKNFEKVLQKNEIIDAVGLNLEDIRKFDKKRGKKTRPIKK